MNMSISIFSKQTFANLIFSEVAFACIVDVLLLIAARIRVQNTRARLNTELLSTAQHSTTLDRM